MSIESHTMSPKKLLILSWEYQEVSSRQGTALARRVGQIARDFVKNGWEVTVIHKDQIAEVEETREYIIKEESPVFKRISIQGPGLSDYVAIEKNKLFRQISTAVICFFKGDRSFRWAKKVIKLTPEIFPASYHPDLIISFFTPRAPLILGDFFSKHFNTRWIADLQDSIDEGYGNNLRWVIGWWMKRILSSANLVTHVSPEWASRDGKIINKKIEVIRHALPVVQIKSKLYEPGEKYRILYTGSLDEKNQSIELFAEVFNLLKQQGYDVELKLAGNEYVKNIFLSKIKDHASVNYIGWLNKNELYSEIENADCLLVIPWSSLPRQVIPSKFFELAPFDKPIWIIGNDTGSFSLLFKEAGHPEININNKEFQINAIKKAFQGDTGLLFELKKCKFSLLSEAKLFDKYMSLLHEL